MNAFGAASYGAASLAFLALTLLLLAGWRGRAQGLRLTVATAVTSLWAAALALQAWDRPIPAIGIHSLEVLRGGVWIAVLLGLMQEIIPRWVSRAVTLSWTALLAAGWVLAILGAVTPLGVSPGVLLIPGGLAIAVAILVLLEQVYRNSSAGSRHGLKFLAIGLGGLYVYDLFLYSQAQMLRGISEELWLGRGFVDALLAPAIAIAARRNPQWSLDVFVSRQVVMFTTTFVAVGIYLLAMAAGGYLMTQLGGSWGVLANIVFLAGALVVLAVVLVSGAVRRRLRVFVSKHFFRNKYDYRVEWLRFVDTLSGRDGEPDVRRTSLRAIAQIFESPGAVMYGRSDAGAQLVPVAAWPMRPEDLPDLGAVPAEHELLRFVVERQWVVDLKEYAGSPELYQNVALPQGLQGQSRMRVLLPLLEPQGIAGFVLLFEPPPPFELTWEDRDLLKTAGRHVATLVAQQEADRRLAESRQFEAYHRLTAFVMHDLKNAVAQLQLVVRNAEKHRHNPAFVDDAIETIGNAVERMRRLIAQLRDSERCSGEEAVDLATLTRGVAERCADRLPRVTLPPLPQPRIVVRADPDRLASTLEHVVRNAQDACAAADTVTIELVVDPRRVRLSVIDTGRGMAPEFVRERLFRPFDSTKGSKGMGIGAFQVREYARSLGGDVEVQSSPGSGTRFDIILPAGEPTIA